MSNNLQKVLLRDIGPVRMCKRVLKSQTSESAEIPFFKISTFGSNPDTFINKTLYDEFRKKYPFPNTGDILISAAGTVGKTVIYNGSPAYFQDSNIVWIENDESQILNSYLYYFFQTKPWLTTNGSTIKRIYNDDLKNIRVHFPNKSEQKKITLLLSTLDSKIEANNKINVQLELLAKLIYDYWFMQFDFPDESGNPYKSSGGEMVWNDELKKQIPVGWIVKNLNELIKEAKNGDWGKESFSDNSNRVFCIRGADINGLNGIEVFDPPVRYIDKSHINRLLKEGDLIVEISGGSPTQSTGRMSHVSKNALDRLDNLAVCSNFCKAISLKNTKMSYVVSRYWSKLYEQNIFFNYEGKTSGIKNLLFDQLSNDVKILVPDNDKLINDYYDFEEVIDKQKQNNLLQNKKLVEIRDWLLPMLINGQVKID